MCANTADSSENPKHASDKYISKNMNPLDPISQRKSVSIWITQNNSSHYEHYCTHIATKAANIRMRSTNPFMQSLKYILEEHGLMNMHIKQIYAAAKIAGVMLTIAAMKMNC